MVKIYLSLGSNKGDRHTYIKKALNFIQKEVFIEKISSFIYSTPVENVKGGIFINGVVLGQTNLAPKHLLSFLQQIEVKLGRSYPHPKGDERVIDIDIIFYGDKIIREGLLTIPHPRYNKRDFVIVPIVEISPNFKDPITGKRMIDLGVTKEEENEDCKEYTRNKKRS